MGLVVGNAEVTGLRLGSHAVTKVMLGSEEVWSAEPVWSPLDIPSVISWWDVEDASTLSLGGGTVLSITDKKSGVVLSQGSASSRPLYSSDGFGGRPAMVFDGADDKLLNMNVGDLYPVGAAEANLWVIAEAYTPGTESGQKCMLGYGNGGNNDRRLRRAAQTSTLTPYVQMTSGSASGIGSTNNTDPPFIGRHLVKGKITPANRAVAMDANSYAWGGAVSDTLGGWVALGAPASLSTQFYEGAINAALITGPLIPDDEAKLISWCMARL